MKHPGLLNDILFKIVFGSQSSEPVLRAFLNALLRLSGPDTIVELEILNPGFDKEFLVEKGPILDVKARDQAGRQYNVEVQLSPGVGDYIARSVFYATKFFADQLERGEPYFSLRRTVSLTIADFDLFPESDALHSTFKLWEPKRGVALTDLLELHYIDLRKFSASSPQDLRTGFERWLYLLKFADLYNEGHAVPANLAQEEGITMAIESMRKAYARDEVREMIEAREKAERDEVSRLEHALRQGLQKGRQEGRQEALRALLESGMSRDEVKARLSATDDELDQL